MPAKLVKKALPARTDAECAPSIEGPAPIASAEFSKITMSALANNAKRLKTTPARGFSKDEIKRFLKKS